MAIWQRRSVSSSDVAVRLVSGDREYVREPGDTLETDLGVLEIPDDVSPPTTLETHLDHTFHVRRLRPPDWFTHFSRTGAPMIPRDIGLLIGETGVGTDDRVLDAGTGTGVLAASLAHVGATVVTVERDQEAAETARENFELLPADRRPTVVTADIREHIETLEDDSFDLISLDTAVAPTVARAASRLLVPGGFLAAYAPFVEGTREIVTAARESCTDVRAIETIQRELDVGERGTRPDTRPVGHTGYLVVGRRP